MKKKLGTGLLIVVIIYLLLMIPGPGSHPPVLTASATTFSWNRDSLWVQLENKFLEAKNTDRAVLDSIILLKRQAAEGQLAEILKKPHLPADTAFMLLQHIFFDLAPLIAVNGEDLEWYASYYSRARNAVKAQSQSWQLQDTLSRHTIYSVLYGMRAAFEEVLLQFPGRRSQPVLPVKDEPSSTPAASIFGITVHSGDLLVSRGGAAVSAFISRGNDYPGNFSHVALLYVDEVSKKPYLVEAHIEKGVAVSTVDAYESDKKLRFMVLRPRAGLRLLLQDPQLPHKAARLMFEEAQRRHIPYDFKMNYGEPAAMFCSEVGSFAYQKYGIQLWQAVSTISSAGTVNWLHDFGVDYFVTQMPSDLEYDSQLAVVAEWRDHQTLLKDHIDNAVMDVLLEQANKGKSIRYNVFLLPVARVIKLVSGIKNSFGKEGRIPEGMSAIQALKNERFVEMHLRMEEKVAVSADAFIRQKGYTPPYWQLIRFAEEAVKE